MGKIDKAGVFLQLMDVFEQDIFSPVNERSRRLIEDENLRIIACGLDVV